MDCYSLYLLNTVFTYAHGRLFVFNGIVLSLFYAWNDYITCEIYLQIIEATS